MPQSDIILCLNLHGAGGHAASWRWPGNPAGAFFDIEHYVKCAKLAENARLDAVFLADTPAINPDISRVHPLNGLEPTINLAVIARETRHIGLIGSASTTYNEPYNLARRFQSLDIVSGGRAGWNAVTTSNLHTSRSFGGHELSRDERYRRAREFIIAVQALWASWSNDPLVLDQATGRFASGDVNMVPHEGPLFRVAAAMTHPPSRQGKPVIFQAGGSRQGLDLAISSADAIFSSTFSLETALQDARRTRDLSKEAGRISPPLILPGVVTVIGGTEGEAVQRKTELDRLLDLEVALENFSATFNIPCDKLHLDQPIDLSWLPKDNDVPFSVGQFRVIEGFARSGQTVREIILASPAYGHRLIVGTPEQVTASFEKWFRAGAVDGFNVIPDVISDGTEAFTEHVVPLLRKRGIFRSDYRGDTLRDHLGLPKG